MDKIQSESVHSASLRLAVILLTCHLCFALWYWMEGMDILFRYNFISIAVFLSDFLFIKQEKYVSMCILNFAEITVFMTLNTILLGWEYGFQYYTFGLLVSAFLVQMQVSKDRRIKRPIVLYAILVAADFILMRIWVMHHDAFYPHLPIAGNMYIVNAALVLSMLISFTLTMLRTTGALEDELIFVAGHDMLTKLPNRRTVETDIMERTPGWLAIMDLDLFKSINDQFGHSAGDEALRTVGKLLADFTRQTGASAGRYGGEEFILYGDGEPDEVRTSLESLRERISRTPVQFEDCNISITATFGAAQQGESASRMLHIADERLYKGKSGGRNRVVWE